MTIQELLARQMDDTRMWTDRLIADLHGDDWDLQPAGGLAHALWICGHLACAQDLLVNIRVLGSASWLDGDFGGHFPIGKPVASAADYDYPPTDVVRKTMREIHAKALSAIRTMSDDLLREPAFAGDGGPHPHYRDKQGAVSHCVRHEAFHAGQIATIRRLLGKPFIR